MEEHRRFHYEDICCFGERIQEPQFWAEMWRAFGDRSIIKISQRSYPEKWRRFYDQVAHLWASSGGSSLELGKGVVQVLINNGVLQENFSVIDVGAGPGSFAIPMAEAGARVKALDYSFHMLERLTCHSRENHVGEILTIPLSWKDFVKICLERFDLVFVAFCPEVFSPEGIQEVESVSSHYCVFVAGVGKDSGSPRERLWRRLMGTYQQCSKPAESFFLLNYLIALGRKPNVFNLTHRLTRSLKLPELEHFYKAYFDIFGLTPEEVQRAIEEEIVPYCNQGFYEWDSIQHVLLLWWDVRETN